MQSNRINFISLAVEDVENSRAFYERLGWIVENTAPNAAFFKLQGAKFMLYSKAALAKDLGCEAQALGVGGVSLAQNFPSEAEVDVAFEHAIFSGGKAIKHPEKVFWGGYSGNFADPDGHIWEYAFNPFSPLDAEGHII